MTGGIICHYVGGSRGGIDSYAANSVLDINRVDQVFVDGVYANENGKDAYNPDNHPMVVDNVSLIGNDKKGRIYIDYYSPEDLYRFEELLEIIERYENE